MRRQTARGLFHKSTASSPGFSQEKALVQGLRNGHLALRHLDRDLAVTETAPIIGPAVVENKADLTDHGHCAIAFAQVVPILALLSPGTQPFRNPGTARSPYDRRTAGSASDTHRSPV